MTDITLPSGGTARIEDGVIHAQPRTTSPVRYKLTAQHKSGGPPLHAFTAQYDDAVAFFKQLERLDYIMRSLNRVEWKE